MKLADQLAQKIKESGEKTLQLFNNLKEEDWSIEVYSDGPAWKIHNLLAHFTEVEAAIPRLIKEILAGSSGLNKDFDIDRYNAKHMEELSYLSREELLEKFEERRKSTIQMVTRLAEKEFDMWGRHPFLGESQIKDMLKLMFLHIRIHERDIRDAIERQR